MNTGIALIDHLHDTGAEATMDSSELINLIQKHSGAKKNNIMLNDFFAEFCERYKVDVDIHHHNHTVTLSSRYRRELAKKAVSGYSDTKILLD